MVSLGGNVRNESELQGIKKGPAGWYLAFLDAADESKVTQNNKFDVDFQLVAGTNQAGVGLIHQERFDVGSDFGQKRATKLALALGILSPQQLGQDVDVSFEAAVGRCCLIQIKDHTYDKKVTDEQTGAVETKTVETTQINGLEMHSVNSKEAAKFPFVAQKLASLQMGGPTQAQQQMPQQAAQQAWAQPVAGQVAPPFASPQSNDWGAVAAGDPF